jgi:hypothetical protein
VAQGIGIGSEFKPQHHKKKRKKENNPKGFIMNDILQEII